MAKINYKKLQEKYNKRIKARCSQGSKAVGISLKKKIIPLRELLGNMSIANIVAIRGDNWRSVYSKARAIKRGLK